MTNSHHRCNQINFSPTKLGDAVLIMYQAKGKKLDLENNAGRIYGANITERNIE